VESIDAGTTDTVRPATEQLMTAWTEMDIRNLADANSLKLTAGPDLRKVVEIGMVVVDHDLYVRAFRGPSSAWFRAAVTATSGTVAVHGIRRSVTFRAVNGELVDGIDDRIDHAFRAKYGDAAPLVADRRARAATLRIAPA